MQQEIKVYAEKDKDGNPTGGSTYAKGLNITWQNGPLFDKYVRQEPNGCFVETVIMAAIKRLEFYQESKFKSEYNERAITKLNEALAELNARTQDRVERGVEGTFKL